MAQLVPVGSLLGAPTVRRYAIGGSNRRWSARRSRTARPLAASAGVERFRTGACACPTTVWPGRKI